MLNRRAFLYASGSLGLSYLLSGCSPQNTDLDVTLLQSSIPLQLLSKFRQSIAKNKTTTFHPESQLSAFYKYLNIWQQEPPKSSAVPRWLPFASQTPQKLPHLITLGNFWLNSAIDNRLIDPLPLNQLSEWQHLPPIWQQLVTYNDKLWAAPYRWGTTVIAYRRDKFKALDWTPQDWSDLWRPEIKGLISVIDQPREIIGLTLKKLGYSYNTKNPDQIPQLKTELQDLNQQIKYYSSQYYLHPFSLGDAWVTVGWSNEILPLAKSNENIAVVIPSSGTAIWADLWVQPARKDNDEPHPLSLEWINFCWQPLGANLISLFTNGISPIKVTLKPKENQKDSLHNLYANLPSDVLKKSEFIDPLSPKIQQTYRSLWEEMRKS